MGVYLVSACPSSRFRGEATTSISAIGSMKLKAAIWTRARGAWRDDPDAAYYVAIYLRAAQFSLRRGCPMRYV
ncbi:MAG TPA: hypothetical protein VFC19_07435 [Candidatus Limnocylindrales bacterium]|nr:hypothetical protein [Candidatus Limnocylindrales bacterium]